LILVDTSAWIELFRRRPRFDFASRVDLDEVVLCLPVLQEVLQGIDGERPYRLVRESLLSLPMVESPLSLDVVELAVALFRTARRGGLTVRSSVDCLIAACALRHDLTVLHLDRDFDLLARVSPLRVRTLERD
jgi:predicted nucleic acid-binding protein